MPSLQPDKVIGHGAFGYVFKCYDNHRRCDVAVKRTQKAGKFVSREYEILHALKDTANIVQMLDFFYSHDSKQRLIQNTVLEFCDSSLEDIISGSVRQPISMGEIKHLMKQVFNGLANMHKLGIAHRDLKPENILLKKRTQEFGDKP